MRKALVVAVAVVALTGSACGLVGGSNTPSKTTTTPSSITLTDEPTRAPQANSGAPCPKQAGFQQAVDESEKASAEALNMTPHPATVRLLSEVACSGPIAAAWATFRLPGEPEQQKVILVIRWKYWRLGGLHMDRTNADKKWETFNYARRFYNLDSVCEESPIINWLKEQGSCLKDTP